MGKTSRDKRDIYYRLAKENKWRARSAFKLMQIDDEFGILKDVTRAVDLCAAPGSWSQVLAKRLFVEGSDAKVVAIDLQPMAPIPGVIQLQGDITSVDTANQVIEHFSGEKSDIVICDGAPDVTGIHSLDEFMQAELILAAFNITSHVLKTKGTFLAKIFRSRNSSLLYAQMKKYFKKVYLAKPRSSRQSSCEAFILCLDYSPPEGFVPTMSKSSLELTDASGVTADVIDGFVTCGDLSGWDSEKSYPLDIDVSFQKGIVDEDQKNRYEFKDVVQPPTDPAYKEALEMKKKGVFSKVSADLTKELKAERKRGREQRKAKEEEERAVDSVAEKLEAAQIEK
uniref:Putative tRNA (cytidine(32)/guanosine(34)-2'-O)-methyltransferase n=1 Tax=Caenorhabditis tropicalis TaxID=1561998 RepID=A0A1I7TT23_9PELO